MITDKLSLIYIGRDDWERPVYACNGRIYVDVNPCQGSEPKIYTKNNDDFYGEPDSPISNEIEISFIPCRDTW